MADPSRVTVRAAAIEIIRLAVDELQPAGREYSDTTQPAWLVAALSSPKFALHVEAEVHGLTKEMRRLSTEIARAADRAQPAALVAKQLGLFGGSS